MSQSHFPPPSGHQTLNHHMDSNILSISHSPSSVIEATPGTANFTHPGSQRKFTLLARPQHLSSNTSISSYQHTLNSADHINSAPCLNQQPPLIQSPGPVIQSPGSVAGRAARNDYYDTEDPSVNLHEFIVNSMQAQKNRIILIKLEEEFITYVSDPTRMEPFKLPPWDSYHRMLAHRVAAYFGLEHNVDPMDKTRVIVCKGPNTRMPQIRFGDYLALNDDSELPEPKLILKRAPKDIAPLDKFEAALASIEAAASSGDVKLKSYEEREEEYEKARARIFSQQPPLQSTHSILPFDLATKSNPRISSGLFPSVMQHRRAASDTAMFKRAVTVDFKKESSMSNQSSRSATPLVSSILRSAGSCELLSSSVDSRVQPPPMQPQTSPKTVQQQQLHASAFENQGQPSQFHSPSTPSSSSNSPSKYTASRAQAQHNNELAVSTALSGKATTSVHYQPLQTGLPVMYPHPQAALLADPTNWYPYQQMMLYQVSPPGYVPTAAHYVGGGSPQLIPGAAVYHPYSVTPGVIGQHALVSPPVSTPPQHLAYPGSVGALARLPIGVDQVSSPSHQNPGVTLVRPISQHPSPMRLAKLDSWNTPQNHQFHMQQSVVTQQHTNPAPPAFATVLPMPQQLTPSHLADQMENILHLSASNGDCGNVTHDATDNDMTPQRDIKPRMRLVSYDSTPSGDGNENDSGFMNPVMSRVPGNGPFPVSSIGEPSLYGGQMISPTHPPGPVQYMQPQMHQSMYGAGSQEFMSNQGVVPNSAVHYSPGTSQPSTPTIGPLNLAPPGILHAQQQGIFSPPTTGITRSPVQILGHTLGTSLFSPPPSSGNQHGLFVNSPTSSGKVGVSQGTPNHPPVGSGTRFRHESPKQVSGHISEVSTSISSQSGFQSLPPRLAGQKSGNRYQNQRHPSNRVAVKGTTNHTGSTGPVTLGDHMPSQFIAVSGTSTSNKREPLLPTPPSTQMVKLDTNLTCGVPLHIMEIVGCHPEGSPEKLLTLKAVNKLSGVVDVKSGRMNNKTGEEVTIVIFDNQDSAMQALQIQQSQFSLSIPRNNHAKFILSMLQQ